MKFIVKTLFSSNKPKYTEELTNFLAEKYDGEVALLYKGREAMRLGLEILNLPRGSRVGITGFTCFTVYKAVIDAGYEVEYLDINSKDLNFSLDTLKKAKPMKAIIIQNTLGNPSDMGAIKNYCLKNRIYILEDLAHCTGSIYKDGQEAGTVGDLTTLSFSQDKIIDAVSGGALIIRNKRFQNKFVSSRFKDVDSSIQLKDRFYPLLTFIIRKTYFLEIGKILHFILKRFNLLSMPMPLIDGKFHKLPHWYANLVISRFFGLDNELKHRREIVNIYKKNIAKSLQFNFSGALRFPISVSNRQGLIKYLRKSGIHVSDIWYDAVISPARYLEATDYFGTCFNSEKISTQIINLPTHINVSVGDAKKISNNINIWLNSQ